ncbi:MAG: hypothetical protein ACT4N5_04455, partial [Nitrosopumilaceae archaeon]
DDLCSPVTAVEQASGNNIGDDNDDGIFDPSETWKFTCEYKVESCESNTIKNTATSTTTTYPGQLPVEDEKYSVEVKCLAPATVLTKSADPTSGPAPLDVTYTYTEENTSAITPLTNVVITDDKCAPVVLDPASDVGSDGILSPGETWTFTCTLNDVIATTTNIAFATADICKTDDCSLVLVGAHTGDPANPESDPNERDDFTVTVASEGCTPGYWKNNADKKDAVSWPNPPYAPSSSYEGIFGVDATLKVGKATVGNPTLLQALNALGGGQNALARHAAAALLNAQSGDVDYPYTVAEIIALVQGAYASGDFTTAKNTLAAGNELGCPINQAGEPE